MRLLLALSTVAATAVLCVPTPGGAHSGGAHSSGAATGAAALPAWRGSAVTISPRLALRMRWSHHAGCPVALADLRYLRTTYLGFDGVARTGELVVHRYYAAGTLTVFRRLYEARFPIRQMRLVDDYAGSDDRSMAADNTSAYNCRRVSGGSAWSEHAYGRAIDINPVENPYVSGSFVAPAAGRPYAHLSRAATARYYRGMIRSNDVVVRAFAGVGWRWGGSWRYSKDYQHFSRTGR